MKENENSTSSSDRFQYPPNPVPNFFPICIQSPRTRVQLVTLVTADNVLLSSTRTIFAMRPEDRLNDQFQDQFRAVVPLKSARLTGSVPRLLLRPSPAPILPESSSTGLRWRKITANCDRRRATSPRLAKLHYCPVNCPVTLKGNAWRTKSACGNGAEHYQILDPVRSRALVCFPLSPSIFRVDT